MSIRTILLIDINLPKPSSNLVYTLKSHIIKRPWFYHSAKIPKTAHRIKNLATLPFFYHFFKVKVKPKTPCKRFFNIVKLTNLDPQIFNISLPSPLSNLKYNMTQ